MHSHALSTVIRGEANIFSSISIATAQIMDAVIHAQLERTAIISCKINCLTQKNTDVRTRGIP